MKDHEPEPLDAKTDGKVLISAGLDAQLQTLRPRPGPPPAGPDFTLIALPDTQYYVASDYGREQNMFSAQTEWVVANRKAKNIVFVTHLGDCVEHGDNGGNDIEWRSAANALYRLEDPERTLLKFGIPYGVAVGNHDQSPPGLTGTTRFYNQYFGVDHFDGRDYYGGHHGTDNDNHYELFSASGLDFIILHLEYDTTASGRVLDWANSVLQTHRHRFAIVVAHYLIGTGQPANWGAQGRATYNRLKHNPNLRLMLCGHVPGEGRRTDVFDGNTVHTLLSDYQNRANGGDGWLRSMEFSPSNHLVLVKTYSPALERFETDQDSEFTIDFDLNSPPPLCTLPPDGLRNWWRAEGDAQGTAENSPGELQGGVTFDPSITGRGFGLDGNDSAVRIPAHPDLDVGNGSGMTIELWMSAGNPAISQPLLGWTDDLGNRGVSLWISASETNLIPPGAEVPASNSPNDPGNGNCPGLGLENNPNGIPGPPPGKPRPNQGKPIRTGSPHVQPEPKPEPRSPVGSLSANLVDTSGQSYLVSSEPGLLFEDGFQHVALTYDSISGEAAIYLDGIAVVQTNIGSIQLQTTSDLYFGKHSSVSGEDSHFEGLLDEIALYDRSLSPEEIQTLHAADLTGKCVPTPTHLT